MHALNFIFKVKASIMKSKLYNKYKLPRHEPKFKAHWLIGVRSMLKRKIATNTNVGVILSVFREYRDVFVYVFNYYVLVTFLC